MFNRVNFEKLATYLESLPEDYEHFDMREWLVSSSRQAISHYAKHNGGVPSCGTAACALGHAPAAGVTFPAPNEDPEVWSCIHSLGDEQPLWWNFGSKYFTMNDRLFDWCFGSDWRFVDNTHRGAAARIRYMLAEKPIPAAASCERHRDLYQTYVVKD